MLDSLTEKDRYILNVVSKRKRNTKVKVIVYQIVYDYRMEITMTDRSVLIWVHEVLGVGTLRIKNHVKVNVKMELNT